MTPLRVAFLVLQGKLRIVSWGKSGCGKNKRLHVNLSEPR